ncbi:MAG: hypothetical protein IJY10_10065 [Lachnospiraceae bacterium]|nr:hypothetical protein [Lachnospiraceae bacterium]MBQ9123818.1 hypothetical protein [Lachnospiraceae bacterium]
MTPEQREILERISAYAETTLADIDPQKVQVSYQLEKLKPIMEEIAKEKNMTLEEVFILYMDLSSEAAVLSNEKLKADLADLGDGVNPILFK